MVRPSRSIRRVFDPRRPTSSSMAPTAMIRPPRTASAPARGAAASMVMMVPPEKMISALSCAQAGRVKTAGAKRPVPTAAAPDRKARRLSGSPDLISSSVSGVHRSQKTSIQRVLVDHAVFHDQVDVLFRVHQYLDVLAGIAVDKNYIGISTGFDNAKRPVRIGVLQSGHR